jgi:hypothetical protein
MKKQKLNLVQLLLFIILIFTLHSCATLFLGRKYTMSIQSDLPNSEVIINDTDRYELPSNAIVARSKKNLDFKVLQNDSIINDTILKPRLSDAFWFGNLYPWLYAAPIAWLVDLNTKKRFTYGKYIFIDSLGNIKSFQRSSRFFSNGYAEVYYRKNKKRNFNILLSIPYINIFHLHPANETPKNNSGFWGLGMSTEYFYKNNKSLQLRGDVITDIPIPVIGAIDFDIYSPRESNTAFNINLTDNFYIKRFQFGYGLNFAKNTWMYHGYYNKPPSELEKNEEPVWIEGKTKTNIMLGLALNTYYRFSKHFYFGAIYRPSLLDYPLPNHDMNIP